MRDMISTLKRIAAVPAALLLSTSAAMASTGGGNLPWDGPLQALEQDITGTVAHVFIIIAIATTGLLWSFGDHGTSMRKVAGIAAGGSMALGAASLITGLSMGSGATIGSTGPGIATLLLVASSIAVPSFMFLNRDRKVSEDDVA
ncbi:TrbC/VirB2 family protein [Acidiphilium sp. PM]|uniref:TrbC/VirB2 family protein n=1 Tax=Acidiphilium sp. PM TaxID=1043206 RepID=UPI0013015C12|nr:TrbC/VirB2 family protein [Acidiphilium sp. PM]